LEGETEADAVTGVDSVGEGSVFWGIVSCGEFAFIVHAEAVVEEFEGEGACERPTVGVATVDTVSGGHASHATDV
jgi:hypothetical protein